MIPADSGAETVRLQQSIQRRLGTAARLQIAIDMSETVRRFALASLRQREPHLSAAELKRMLWVRLYGVSIQG